MLNCSLSVVETFTMLSLKRNCFRWHTVARLIPLSFECVCQPVPIYAASLYHYLSQGDELLDENSKELNGETTEKAVWGPSA